MDDFLTKKRCDRCGGSLKNGRIMSMFNEDCICLKCKDEERKRPDYEDAVRADVAACARGNFFFKGIGF